MPPSGYSLRAHMVESLIRINRPNVPPRVVLRNTAAVILPLAVGFITGYPVAGLGVAAGALNTMFADQPGPYRQRLRNLLLTSFAAGLAALLGFLVGGELLPILLTTAALGFCGGMLVVFGTDTARVGMTSMILLVITAASPTTPGEALIGAALIFGGGLLLTAFSLAAWPWQRYFPERQALALVYVGLAELARQPAHDDTDAPVLTDAMTILQQTLLGRDRGRGRAMEAFEVLLELAERIRLELTAMNELQTHPALHARFRDDAARLLTATANALQQGDSPRQAVRILQALQTSEQALLERHDDLDGMAGHIHALSGQLAAAVRNADWAGSRGELRASAAETLLPELLRSNSAWATLRANLAPSSVAFRHAVRTAACLTIALLISRLWQLPHGYWVPMTAAIVLRPDFAATFNFGLLRVLGTILGLVLTTVLLHITPDLPWAHLLLMALLCMAFRYAATAHYGMAVAALTGTVVILLSFEGVDSGVAVMDRVINTVLGCGMALLAYVAWPTWERGRARAALAAMLDAYAAYLRALMQPDHNNAHRASRTSARMARTNAQASLERMRSEPATPPDLLALARAIFANGNRLARTAMALEATLDDLARLPDQTDLKHFVNTAAETLDTIAHTLREQRPLDASALPDLRTLQRTLASQSQAAADHATADLLERISDRLADNIQALIYVMNRGKPDGASPTAQLPVLS